MLEILTPEQRARLRQQLDELDTINKQSEVAAQEAASQDFGESYTPTREYVDQAADLVNQIEQTTGQPTGIDPYAGQDNSFLKREPQSQRYMVTKLADGREYRTPITQTPKSVDNQIIEEGEDEQGNYYNIRKGDPADIDIELEPLDISARNKFSTGRAPAGDALSFLSDPYGSVMKTIAPNQSIPPRPMSPLTSSVVETVAPTPKQVVVPLEQRGAQNVKVSAPVLPPKVGAVSVRSGSSGVPRPNVKVKSTEAKPVEERNIQDIDSAIQKVDNELSGMPSRFDLGVEAEKSKFGIEQEVAGEGARRQGEFMLQESQIADDYKNQAQKRIEEGDRIIKERLPVDPNRWFNSRSLGQKIAFAIALGFDRTGKNTQFLMNLINQDIAAQEKEYDQKGKDASNMFAVAKELLGNSQAARKATQEAFKSYTEKLAEAQKAGLNINSPQVQYKVSNDLTKDWQENMKIKQNFIGAQLDAQKASQERRFNDESLLLRKAELEQKWAESQLKAIEGKMPDIKDRTELPFILRLSRNQNTMEKLQGKVEPTSPQFAAYVKLRHASDYNPLKMIAKGYPKEYGEYYNALFDFVNAKLRKESGAAISVPETQDEIDRQYGGTGGTSSTSVIGSDSRKRYINEQISGLTNQGRSMLESSYPYAAKYLIQQR